MSTAQQIKLLSAYPEPSINIGMIYETTYKKGNLLQRLHFQHEGSLAGAIAKVKTFCYRHHLMHIHTVPFLINLDSVDSDNEAISDAEGIDITKDEIDINSEYLK